MDKKVTLIAALAQGGVYAVEGDLPWGRELKTDLRFFKQVTLGTSIVMGRATWESLGQKALPGRENIVVSGTLLEANGALVVKTLQEAIEIASYERVSLIGGSRIWMDGIESGVVSEVLITEVDVFYAFEDAFRCEALYNLADRYPYICTLRQELLEETSEGLIPLIFLRYARI